MTEERWLTVAEIAAMLRVHEQTVREWLRQGQLKGRSFGGRTGYRVAEADLRRFLREREAETIDERPYTAEVLARFDGDAEAARAAERRDREEIAALERRVSELLEPLTYQVFVEYPALRDLPEEASVAAASAILRQRVMDRDDLREAVLHSEVSKQIAAMVYEREGTGRKEHE